MSSRIQGPTLRERRQEETRQEIMRAGIKVFSRRGFQSATVDEIAQVAGISRATYYLYFAGKAELSVAIGTQGVPAMKASYGEFATMNRPTLEEVREWVEAHARAWKKHRVANVLGLRGSIASAKFDAADRAITEEMLQEFAPLIEHYAEPDREAARARLVALIFQLEMCMYEIFERKRFGDPDVMLDALAVMWHREAQEVPAE